MIDKIAIGRRGEKEAEKALKKGGYRIIERNFRCRHGEIDIVAQDGDTIVFVEVKTRGSDRFGSPGSSVDSRKQRHMVMASSVYIAEKGLVDCLARFDVVSVEIKDGRCSTELIKDAFEAGE